MYRNIKEIATPNINLSNQKMKLSLIQQYIMKKGFTAEKNRHFPVLTDL